MFVALFKLKVHTNYKHTKKGRQADRGDILIQNMNAEFFLLRVTFEEIITHPYTEKE